MLVRERRRLGRELGVDHELRDARCGRAGRRRRGRRGRGGARPSRRGSASRRRAPCGARRTCACASVICGQSAGKIGVRDRFVRLARAADERVVGPDHDRRLRAGAARLGQLALQRAARVVGVGGDAAPAKVGEERRDELARPVRLDGDEDVDRRRLCGRAAPPPRARAAAARCRRRSRRRASAGRRSPRPGSRSGRRRRWSSSRSPSARRTPRSCACSSRARGRASARARSATPVASRSARTAAKCSTAGVAERVADRRRLLEQLSHARAASPRGCRARAAGSCAPSRASPRRARRRARRASARSFSTYAGRQARSPIEFSSRRYFVDAERGAAACRRAG